MWKKKILVVGFFVFAFLGICTLYSVKYEQGRLLPVKVAMPELTEDRTLKIPIQALGEDNTIWVVEKKESIWGIDDIAGSVDVDVISEDGDYAQLSGLPNGVQTMIVTEGMERLAEESKVKITFLKGMTH